MKNVTKGKGHYIKKDDLFIKTLQEKGIGAFLIFSQPSQAPVKDYNSLFRKISCSPVMVPSLYKGFIC